MAPNNIINFGKLLKIKRYSKNTITVYLSFLQLFESIFNIKDWECLSNKDLLNFSYQYISKKNLSYSSQKQLLSVLKLFYSEMFNRYVNLDSVRPKVKPNSNPVVLSKSEIKKLINSSHNLKHKAVMATIYSLGLRSGELINLKIVDLDGDRDIISVVNSKGDKDRIVMFSNKLKTLLRNYYKEYTPKKYLFEGINGGQYSRSSLQNILKKYGKIAGIKKSFTVHTLRHSFATHLLEEGVGISHIQKLLGHSNIKTTLIYTQIAKDSLMKIKSPLDSLEI